MEDQAIMVTSDMALIISYLCVLIVKTCDLSSTSTATLSRLGDGMAITKATCSTYGFGESAAGESCSQLYEARSTA